jgi:hypothetical protein
VANPGKTTIDGIRHRSYMTQSGRSIEDGRLGFARRSPYETSGFYSVYLSILD